MPILTLSSQVPSVSTGGAFGTPAYASGNGANTSGSTGTHPTATLRIATAGDLLIGAFGIGGNPGTPQQPNAISSPSSTGWKAVAGPAFNAAFSVWESIWMGTAVAVTAGETITVAWSNTGFDSWFSVVEFTASLGSNTIWSIDQTSTKQNTSSGTITWPTLTPTGTNELYFGASTHPSAGSAGVTAGYTYFTDPDGSICCFNPAVSAASTPTASQSPSATSTTVGALIRVQAPAALVNTTSITLNQVPTGRMWVISQIGFEVLPASVATNITVTATLNGRTLYGNINAIGGYIQGPPFITIRSGDNLTITWTNAPVASSMIANFYYSEYSAYETPPGMGGII